jgi:hypothetical protein
LEGGSDELLATFRIFTSIAKATGGRLDDSGTLASVESQSREADSSMDKAKRRNHSIKIDKQL